MPDQSSSQTPAKNTDPHPLSESPVLQTTPQQNEVGKQSDSKSTSELNTTAKLERDIKKGEIALIAINFLLLVVTIVIAKIYYGQLQER